MRHFPVAALAAILIVSQGCGGPTPLVRAAGPHKVLPTDSGILTVHGDQIVDVVSQAAFIDAGTKVIIQQIRGNRVVVRPCEENGK